jgi:prepilin-type N-terminal cleavage/methylation domain-containing protein
MYTFYNEGKKGFTMIEVLASMAVLIVILLALVRLFDEASRAYGKGTTSVSRSAAARTAMEMITRDIEGAVIDRDCQFYKEDNTEDTGTPTKPGAGFDEFFFVTMEGNQTNDRSYQLVHYYVNRYTATNAGAEYQGFKLMRGAVDTDIVKKKTGINVLSDTNPWDWWKNIPGDVWNPVIVADNIVRFDISILAYGCDGNLYPMGMVNGWKLGNGCYSSKQDWIPYPHCGCKPKQKILPGNTPPAYVDIYLQITSDAAMRRGGATFLAGDRSGDNTLRQEGRSLMYRESSVLVTRIHPTMWAAQVAHPISY